MDSDKTNEETLTAETEQKTPSETENVYASQPADKTSDEETVKEVEAEGTEKEEEETLTFKKGEFEKAVQSAADKATATARNNALKEVQDLRKEIERSKADDADRVRRAAWQGRQQAERQKWIASGVDEDAVSAFQAREDLFIEEHAELKRRQQEFAPKVAQAESYEAIVPVISDVFGEDVATKIGELIEAVKEGEGIKHKTALAKLKAIELKNGQTTKKTVAKPTTPSGKPSSSTSTTPGGTRTFTRAQLADRDFYKKHQKEIDEAAMKGLIK